MAEFQEVCRQALRMGMAMNDKAGYLLEYAEMVITAAGEVPVGDGRVAVTPDALEREIMEWAAAHPEPRYPSWNETWVRLFPYAHLGDSPCPNHFLQSERSMPCAHRACNECKSLPIPADIAEKLGIKPIEGTGV